MAPAIRSDVDSDITEGTGARPVSSVLQAVGALLLLYLFLTGVGLLEEGIGALGGDLQQQLFGRVTNPVAGLCVGVLATVLVQSSSVTTATIVGLVAGGVITVPDAVPMVMGANIGTSVTNTLAAFGSVRRPTEFSRTVAAATIHDLFNLLAVAVLLPFELATGILARAAESIGGAVVGAEGTTFKSPLKQAVEAPVSLVADIVASATGDGGAVFAAAVVVVGIVMIFGALTFLTRLMKALIADQFEAAINRILGSGSGIVAMGLGIVLTIAVQSSSITTSVLVPLAAAGVVSLRNLYPVTLGANLGTTFTALLASLATDRPEALTVALVHTLFNGAGILLFYGVPVTRDIPARLAEGLGRLSARNRLLVVAYVPTVFIVLPLVGVLVLG